MSRRWYRKGLDRLSSGFGVRGTRAFLRFHPDHHPSDHLAVGGKPRIVVVVADADWMGRAELAVINQWKAAVVAIIFAVTLTAGWLAVRKGSEFGIWGL